MRHFLLLVLVAFSMGTTACRRYSPVERHFLRVPASQACDLSGIDRGKWLKQLRKQPGAAKIARQEHYLYLPEETRPASMAAPPGEVKFYPDAPGSQQGMVALHWLKPPAGAADPDTSQLFLLKTEGGRYLPQPLSRWLTVDPKGQRYSLTAEPDAITTYQRSSSRKGAGWKKGAVLRWKNGKWNPG